jgi:4-hydroxysphinganine ceramide fatty acyl 2-hydroxylase
MERNIGKDITKMYDKIESHQTKSAHRDMDSFCIGHIKMDGNNKMVMTETETTYDIDLKRGVLWQVFQKLNLKQYLEFIHDPKHMINPPEAIMFETPFLEAFTKNPFWIILVVYIPIILFNLYSAYNEMKGFYSIIATGWILGMFIWTFTEYVLHRFLFHYDERLPDNKYAIMLHFLFHGIHHAFPMDK